MSETKGQGYNSSFLNFVGQNPLEAEQNNEDKNSEGSSEDSEPVKEEISQPKPAKRGRLLGPKSVRRQHTRNDSSNSHSGSSDEDVEPPATARRVRTVRAAKVKALQLNKGTLFYTCYPLHIDYLFNYVQSIYACF